MSDDDLRTAMWVAFCCCVGALVLILLVLLSTPARAAALLTLDGQRIVVMTGPELVTMLKGRDDEIAELKAKLDAKHKTECDQI